MDCNAEAMIGNTSQTLIKILGEAGSGKSTVLKRIEYLLAKKIKNGSFNKLPVYVELYSVSDGNQILANKIAEVMNIDPAMVPDFLGYTNSEMIDIYMNTCMHCSYPLHLFLRKVFFTGKELDLRGRFADMRQYFRAYPMSAQVVAFENGFRLSFNNTFNGYRCYSFSPQWWNEHKRYCSEYLKKGQRVTGYITALDLQTFHPCMDLILNEEEVSLAEKLSGNDLHYFIKLLEDVITQKELTTSANHRIRQLYFPLPLPEETWQLIDLLILKCCAALSGNYSQVRYMINMANLMIDGRLNRYKYRYDSAACYILLRIRRTLFQRSAGCG